MRKLRRVQGFTLVELLVVIGIIAVLISILLPALNKARDTANTIKCAANLRSIGQGIAAYTAANNNWLPAAYNFNGSYVDNPGFDKNGSPNTNDIGGIGVDQFPYGSVYGYISWNSFLLGTVPPDAFKCPALDNGGLPPAQPDPTNFDPGQLPDKQLSQFSSFGGTPQVVNNGGGKFTAAQYSANGVTYTYAVDTAAPRIAYSLNENLCPRPKYVASPSAYGSTTFQNVQTTEHNIQINTVRNQSATILATEFPNDWHIVAGQSTAASGACKSHRPIQAWRLSGISCRDIDKVINQGVCDLTSYAIGSSLHIRKSVATDLWLVPASNQSLMLNNGGGLGTDGSSIQSIDIIADLRNGAYVSDDTKTTTNRRGSRLDWVGRNHPNGGKYAADNLTNFLYADGHVESKSILATIPRNLADYPTGAWEWGEPYTLTGGIQYEIPSNSTTGYASGASGGAPN